jgi:hypothetical protein
LERSDKECRYGKRARLGRRDGCGKRAEIWASTKLHSGLERDDMGSSLCGKADLRAEPPASGQSSLMYHEIA